MHSPLIPLATADFIVCFEMLEAIRKIPCLAKGGTLLVNRTRIDPVPVSTGDMKYPGDIEKWLGGNIEKTIILDGEAVMKEKDASRSLNIIMLGALSTFLKFSEKEWETAIMSCVREKFLEMNLNAFKAGRELILSPA